MYCKDCAFVEVKDDLCFCRFLPPFYHIPVVKPEDFCGQFKAIYPQPIPEPVIKAIEIVDEFIDKKSDEIVKEMEVILEEKQVVILEEEKPEVKIITKEDTSIKKNKKKKA